MITPVRLAVLAVHASVILKAAILFAGLADLHTLIGADFPFRRIGRAQIVRRLVDRPTGRQDQQRDGREPRCKWKSHANPPFGNYHHYDLSQGFEQQAGRLPLGVRRSSPRICSYNNRNTDDKHRLLIGIRR